MRLWKRASGALKDQNSIVRANLAWRIPRRNPDMEAAMIKATSHDDSWVDYVNHKRVLRWITLSHLHLDSLVLALCKRIKKTKSWVVALKGLMLMHGVLCVRNPMVQMIGRLPFSMSNFEDDHSRSEKSQGFNAFVRAYYEFVDQKSAYLSMDLEEKEERIYRKTTVAQDLLRLQRMQVLLDLLMDIKPQGQGERRITTIIEEAMDGVFIEIYGTYSRLCYGIAKVLLRMDSTKKAEASVALKILEKSAIQGKVLSEYFHYCKLVGALNKGDFPIVQEVPEEDIRELEKIANGYWEEKVVVPLVEDKAMIVVNKVKVEDEEKDLNKKSKTVVTENWEVFDDDLIKDYGARNNDEGTTVVAKKQNPFDYPLIEYYPNGIIQHEIPDFISFT